MQKKKRERRARFETKSDSFKIWPLLGCNYADFDLIFFFITHHLLLLVYSVIHLYSPVIRIKAEEFGRELGADSIKTKAVPSFVRLQSLNAHTDR